MLFREKKARRLTKANRCGSTFEIPLGLLNSRALKHLWEVGGFGRGTEEGGLSHADRASIAPDLDTISDLLVKLIQGMYVLYAWWWSWSWT